MRICLIVGGIGLRGGFDASLAGRCDPVRDKFGRQVRARDLGHVQRSLESGKGKPQRLHEHFVGLLADVFLRVGERRDRGLQPLDRSDAGAVAVLGDFAELVHDFLQRLDVLFVGRRRHARSWDRTPARVSSTRRG